jgi:hypothetical protein
VPEQDPPDSDSSPPKDGNSEAEENLRKVVAVAGAAAVETLNAEIVELAVTRDDVVAVRYGDDARYALHEGWLHARFVDTSLPQGGDFDAGLRTDAFAWIRTGNHSPHILHLGSTHAKNRPSKSDIDAIIERIKRSSESVHFLVIVVSGALSWGPTPRQTHDRTQLRQWMKRLTDPQDWAVRAP